MPIAALSCALFVESLISNKTIKDVEQKKESLKQFQFKIVIKF